MIFLFEKNDYLTIVKSVLYGNSFIFETEVNHITYTLSS